LIVKGVPAGIDKGTFFEKGVDDISLHSFSFSVDDSDLFKAFLLALQEIFFQ